MTESSLRSREPSAVGALPGEGRPRVLQPAGWPMPRGYSNGMMAQGHVVVTGGVVGWDEREIFPEGFVAQARQTFLNIRAILSEAGAEPHHLVRLTWYVVSIDEYLGVLPEMGRAYREVFGRVFPAMALVQVVRLVEPRARLEIEATAVLPA